MRATGSNSAVIKGAGPLVVALVLVVIAARGGEEEFPHRLAVTVPQATNVVKGQHIRLAGSPVGKVTSIEPVRGGRAARVGLSFGDRAWPIRRGSRLTLRWGGTVSFANRYFRLEPDDDADGTAYADGEDFEPGDVVVPVEFDSLLRAFDARTRADVSRFLTTAGPALGGAKDDLRAALDVAPSALGEGADVLEMVEDQRAALATTLRSGSRVLGAVDTSQPDLKALLAATGTTLDAVADEATALQEGLSMAPGTFTNVRDTLRRADPSLVAVARLSERIAPGVTEVRRTAAPLAGAVGAVRRVGPDARATLATLRRAAPELNPLLRKVTTLSPTLERIGEQAVDNLECIRPYTPDVIGFFTNWGDFFTTPDPKDKIIRATVQAFLPGMSNATPYDSGAAKDRFPSLEFGFPRPPGTNAGQPWFLPECGAGPDALDPDKDPEARWSRVAAPPLVPVLPTRRGSR